MSAGWITIIVQLASSIIREYYAKHGKLPSDAEVIAELAVQTQAFIAIGEAWLAAHPETPETPQ